MFQRDLEEQYTVDVWAEAHKVQLNQPQPRKPTQNAYVKRWNRTNRDEVPDFYLFSTLSEVRDITEGWIKEYNEERPHDSLGDMTPAEYLEAHAPHETSTFGWQ